MKNNCEDIKDSDIGISVKDFMNLIIESKVIDIGYWLYAYGFHIDRGNIVMGINIFNNLPKDIQNTIYSSLLANEDVNNLMLVFDTAMYESNETIYEFFQKKWLKLVQDENLKIGVNKHSNDCKLKGFTELIQNTEIDGDECNNAQTTSPLSKESTPPLKSILLIGMD